MFSPQTDLDPRALQVSAGCSLAAYQAGAISDAPGWRELNLELVGQPFEHPDKKLRGFVAQNDRHVVVSFRGTIATEIVNWKRNIDLAPYPTEPNAESRVHAGFNEAFDALQSQIRTLLTPLQIGSRQVILTGHSLGAAMAVIAGFRLHDLLKSPEVFTFGQPMVGNEMFSRIYPASLYRFVNDKDPVPLVPEVRGYRHFGRLIHFDSRGRIMSTTGLALQLQTALQVVAQLKELRKRTGDGKSLADLARERTSQVVIEAVGDHSMSGYQTLIAKNFPLLNVP